ncbi:MAG: putative sulfate exporter family transporter [Bacteroidetes bacterium]|nr:putative sulfate exporter family transporter [Bacteroidota bacterium]
MPAQPLQTELFRKIIFIVLAVSCFTPIVSPPIALLLGIVFSQIFINPFKKYNSKATKILLQTSVVGLGFGMNLFEAAKAGQDAIIFTIATISLTILLGFIVGKLLTVNSKTAMLISVGTAICGGSAIAAVSPVIEAGENEISVSLGIIFLLNSLALFLFPVIGHIITLSQAQFGWWSAIAIHDTSSVVGAAHAYGTEALKIATTIKLERALWIIPVSLFASFAFKSSKRKITIPYFIFLFVVAMAINTFIPSIQSFGNIIVFIAKKGLTLTLFLIGSGLSRSAIKSVGFSPFLLGVILWIVISISSLFVILKTVP